MLKLIDKLGILGAKPGDLRDQSSRVSSDIELVEQHMNMSQVL